MKCIHVCRCTTIPGRTKGRRKVQIKLRNCRALQPQPEKPIMTVGGGEGERGGETRTSEYNPTTEKYCMYMYKLVCIPLSHLHVCTYAMFMLTPKLVYTLMYIHAKSSKGSEVFHLRP